MIKLDTWNKKKWIFIGLVFVFSFIIAYCLRMGVKHTVNSDETTCYDMMEDFFNGNYTLKGWYFSTGLFLLPSMVMFVFVKIFGNTDLAIYFMSAFNWGLFITVAIYSIYKVAYETNNGDLPETRLVYPLTAGIFLIVPRSGYAYNAGTHVLSVAASIICFYLIQCCIQREQVKIKTFLLTICSVFMGIISATNTMFMYSAIIPLVLTGMLLILDKKDIKNGLMIICSGLAAFGVQIVFKKIWIIARGSAFSISSATIFVSTDNLWNNVSVGILNGLRMFGIDPWGQELFSLETAKTIIGGVLLFKFAKEIACYILKKDKGKEAPLFYYFLFLGIVNLSAYTFSTMATEHSGSTHLIFPFLFGITISGLIGWISNLKNARAKNIIYVYFGLALFFLILMKPKLSIHRAVDEKKDVARYLVENRYDKGYGGFWSSSSIAYFAEGYSDDRKVTIAPIMGGPAGRLQAEPWLTTEAVIGQSAFYFVCSKWELETQTPENRINASFGMWDDKVEFGEYNLYIWNDSISTFGAMGNGDYKENICLSDETMRIEDGTIRIQPGQSIFGPYVSLFEGEYAVVIRTESQQTIPFNIVTSYGTKNLTSGEIKNGYTIIPLSISEYTTDIEFICTGGTAEGGNVDIKEIRVGNMDNEGFKDYLHNLGE